MNPAGDDVAHRAALRLVTLLAERGPMLGEEGLRPFEEALSPLLSRCSQDARAEVAERIAEVGTAPSGVVMALARDVIAVARPILLRSPALADQDLIAVAVACGPEHLLAIARRRRVPAPVGDVLIAWGDRPVWHALAGNGGAGLSLSGAAELVARAQGDPLLQDLLGRRAEVDGGLLARLVEMARAEARGRILGSLAPVPSRGVQRPAVLDIAHGIERARRSYEIALGAARALAARRPIGEDDVAGLAAAGETEATICAVAAATGLTLVRAEDLFDAADESLLLIVARAQGWSWRTVRALLRLRDPRPAARHHLRRPAAIFESVSGSTASRVLGLIRAQEVARATAPSGPARRNVR